MTFNELKVACVTDNANRYATAYTVSLDTTNFPNGKGVKIYADVIAADVNGEIASFTRMYVAKNTGGTIDVPQNVAVVANYLGTGMDELDFNFLIALDKTISMVCQGKDAGDADKTVYWNVVLRYFYF